MAKVTIARDDAAIIDVIDVQDWPPPTGTHTRIDDAIKLAILGPPKPWRETVPAESKS